MQSFEHWSQAGWRYDSSKVKIIETNHVLGGLSLDCKKKKKVGLLISSVDKDF